MPYPQPFESFDVFLAHLYLTVKPGISGAPSAVLPALLADLQGRWRSISFRSEICGEIRKMLVAVEYKRTSSMGPRRYDYAC